jgi:uncharacterized tellurite resistance protein B-like protein
MEHTPRRLIVRLAVAVMAADGRITVPELEAIERLDRLGLGPLGTLVREEIQRAMEAPIDVRAACAELAPLSAEAGAVILTALAEIATSDRILSAREAEMLETIARLLQVPPAVAAQVLESALGACGPAAGGAAALDAGAAAEAARPGAARAPEPPSPERAAAARPASPRELDAMRREIGAVRRATPERAWRMLGIEPGASRAELDAAYVALVRHYDPAKVTDLGPEFAALAVRRLAEITAAYEALAASPDEPA